MKSSDRTIVLVVLGLAVVAGLWFGLISPKRSEVAKLDDEVATQQAAVSQQEQLALAAVEAKDDYKADYERLIVLGKAVPGDDDVASLMDQVNGLAERAGVTFSGLKLSADAATTDIAAPAATETPPSDQPADTPVPTPAPATETAVAGLPLGATVGPAGLPVMPYDLTFKGTFFDIADFMAGLDGLVRAGERDLGVDGRLLTVDGFSLAPDPNVGFPTLVASLRVTTFVAPADQGLTAGATPATPAPGTTPAETTTATPAPTAAATAPTP